MERESTGGGEAIASNIASLDQLDGEFQKSDGGDGLSPVSSQYSSCGESEFERYCSANSVMGTPSLCSSMGIYHDFGDSDSGSLNSPDRFSLGGERFPRRFEERPYSPLSGKNPGFGDSVNDAFYGVKDEEEGLNPVDLFEGRMDVIDHVGSSSSMLAPAVSVDRPTAGLESKADLKGVKVLDNEAGKKEDLVVLLKNVENVLLQGAVAARSAAETLFDCSHADEMEDERCREQDETSSKYEHSDGEDSMFNYGSDAESQPTTYYVRNMAYPYEKDTASGHSVLMNASMAFGSKDWEDFELDGGENPLTSQVPENFWESQELGDENSKSIPDFCSMVPTCGNFQLHDQERNEMDPIAEGNHLLGVGNSLEYPPSHSTANINSLKFKEAEIMKDHEGSPGTCLKIDSNDGPDEYLESCSIHNIFKKPNPPNVPSELGSVKGEEERDCTTASARASDDDNHAAMPQNVDPLPDIGIHDAFVPSMNVDRDLMLDVSEGDKVELSVQNGRDSVSSWLGEDKNRSCNDSDIFEDETTARKGKDLEMNAVYDDFVHEMEEILLDSCVSQMGRLKERNAIFNSKHSSPLRDGGSTASTSGLDIGFPSVHHSLCIDGIEVVGAKKKKGDISLSERLVGVKEYTVYIIRVWTAENQWEVERRYRDFYALYRELKTLFAAKGWILPPPWSSVERESRKFFGNGSPDVIAERSTLIQQCLCSILQSSHYSSLPSAVIWFLSLPETLLHSPKSNAVVRQSTVGTGTERVPNLGKTISLIVDIRPQKSLKELLDTQHYTCAGCHEKFDNGKTRVQEIAQTFGWGKPRFCEYTGQLFCSSCHSNDGAVLPARVLHHWDFTPYPVSQLAKSYLDSIIDQPMLCVSAANPFLFSKVPTLLHIVGVRRKIGAMLPYIRCSFRRSVYGRLGYRKYLLETKDFFALRDLIDLSKGAFAALPPILDAVLKKMQEHIIELCLECCDNGVPCGARRACDNPSSLIFPFQEDDEIQRCKSCKSVFHNYCFNKLAECPCGAVLKPVGKANLGLVYASDNSDGSSLLLTKQPVLRSSSSRFLSSLFSVAKEEKKSDNVILMGSLPSTSL